MLPDFSGLTKMALNIDDLISRLLNVGEARLTLNVSEKEIQQLCETVREVFKAQSSFLEVEPPLTVVGDIHGQVIFF